MTAWFRWVALGLLVPLVAIATPCIQYGKFNTVPQEWVNSLAASCPPLGVYNGLNRTSITYEDGGCNLHGLNGYGFDSIYTWYPPVRTGDCGPNCPAANSVAVKNITRGYAGIPHSTTSYNDYLPSGAPNVNGPKAPPVPVSVCDGGCGFTVDGPELAFWQNKEPTAGGLYRNSTDHKTWATGQACTADQNAQDVNSAIVAPVGCQGTEGYFQGKKVCVPKSASQTNVVASVKGLTAGNPTAGTVMTDNTKLTGAERAAGIPATGDGGNGGGPRQSGDGTTVMPDGTTISPSPSTSPSTTKTATAGEEQVACGAPGQPECAVKVDETGTKSDNKTDEAGLKAARDLADTKLTDILSSNGKDTSWAMPGWFNQGACTAWQLGTLPLGGSSIPLSVDLCPLMPYLTGVINFLWVAGTFLAVLAMMNRVMF